MAYSWYQGTEKDDPFNNNPNIFHKTHKCVYRHFEVATREELGENNRDGFKISIINKINNSNELVFDYMADLIVCIESRKKVIQEKYPEFFT